MSRTIRGILPGEYVVNVHQYRAAGFVPVPVTIRVEKLNPKVTLVFYGTVDLDYTGQERTAVRFTVAGDGSVSGVSTLEKPLATAAHRRAHDTGGARRWQAALDRIMVDRNHGMVAVNHVNPLDIQEIEHIQVDLNVIGDSDQPGYV